MKHLQCSRKRSGEVLGMARSVRKEQENYTEIKNFYYTVKEHVLTRFREYLTITNTYFDFPHGN